MLRILSLLLPLLSLVFSPLTVSANPTWSRNPTAEEISQATANWLNSQGPVVKESLAVNYHDKSRQPAGDGAHSNEVVLF